MQVGDLVRIISANDSRYLGKLAIVLVKGTWSVDVYLEGCSGQPRFAIEDLEVLCK